MCRKNQLCGCMLAAFGVGLLFGNLMESGFFCFCLGIGFAAAGVWCLCKK